jgi:hypothetical protein
MPLATEGVSGERAAEGVDLPSIERIRTGWKTPGLGCVGDGQRSAWDTRASLARPQDWDVSPWPLTGATAAAMAAWITVGVTKRRGGEVAQRWRTKDQGQEGLAAEGEACERACGALGGAVAWRARVVGVRSPLHANRQAAGLATRLRHAETQRTALPPQRSGETAHPRRSNAPGGDGPRAPRAAGGGVAPRGRGKAGRADPPRRGPGARFSAPREARHPENPLPSPPFLG